MRVWLTLVLATLLAPLAGAGAPDWRPLTEDLVRREKPGFGKLCGVLVDHATGDLLVNLSDRGFFRSTDQGQTWQAHGQPLLKGRTETPGCLLRDPTGKTPRLLVALVYGSPLGVSRDGGATWKTLSPKSTHVDWCAADWTDPALSFLLTLKHESGDLLLASRDGGQSFEEVGKGFGPAWIFDRTTAVAAEAKSKTKPRPGLVRTTDAGKTFEPCGDYHARALPRWHAGTLYWVVAGALIRSTDQGRTWQKCSDLKDGRYGPVFGKSAQHLFVLTGAGIVESSDGGTTWTAPLALPKELRPVGALTWLEYDPVHDLLYAMKMGSELYQLRRGR